MKVLHVIPSLAYSGTAMQLVLLNRGLPPGKIETRICVLGKEGPCADPLRAAGIPVEALDWTRSFDPRPPWQFRRLVRRFRPDVIHTWGRLALRTVALAAGRTSRLVVSKPLAAGCRPGRLDSWWLARADTIAATGFAEAARCRALGVGDRLAVVPPGVDNERPWSAAEPAPTFPQPFILCTGPLEPHKGFRDAIWGFDILRYLYPDLSLVLVGSGSDRPRLEQFTRRIGAEGYVRFAGDRADVPTLLARADLVWVPSRAEGGVTFALEAMAAGRPVIASRLPGLAEVIADGAAGFLVPPGDKIAVARQTRLLLNDAERRRSMGHAGQERVQGNFGVAHLVQRFITLYDNLAA